MTESKPNSFRPKGNRTAFIAIGFAMLAVGISTDNPGFYGAAVAFIVLGMIKRNRKEGE